MDVVYFGSREIYRDFYIAIASLREHNPEARIWALTEGEDLGIPGVTCLEWEWRRWFGELPTRTKWKQFGPIRAAFSKVFPQLDRVISLDCDTIVLDDITPLWELDLQDCHAAMCPEVTMDRPYHNNGVCVMDLARIRAEGVDDQMIAELNSVWHPYVGQDAMQMYCRVLDLPSEWNDCKFTAPCSAPKIMHFADRTDWRELEIVRKYRRRET